MGQTYDSNQTLEHYVSNPKGQAVLFVGDLSYADNFPFHDNVKWDTWGRFVEKSTAYQPWIWTAGNHELDFAPEIVSLFQPRDLPLTTKSYQLSLHFVRPAYHSIIIINLALSFNCIDDDIMFILFQEEYIPFKPYMHRYHVPYRASQSTSPLWYSIKCASAYIIVLSSYSAYGIKFLSV